MTTSDHNRAGAAMRWRAFQLAGVQGIYLVRLLLLAQLLAPDAFGLVAVAMVAIGVIARLTDLGMVSALVQRQSAVAAEYDAAWTIGLARGLAITLVLTAFALPVARIFGDPAAAPVIQALAWRPAIEAAASIGIVRLTRQLEFRRLAMIAVPAALVDLAVAVLTAGQLGVWALVAGALAGSGTTVLLSHLLAPHRPRLSFRFESIRPLIRYGRWILATGVIGLVGNLLSQIAISRVEGVAALGLYFLAWRVASLPSDAIGSVVSSVAFPMFARLRDDTRKTATTFRMLLTGETTILLPGYALVFVLAPALELVLGERWAGTTPIIRILSVAAVAGTLGELVAPLLMGRGRADRAFVFEALQTGVLVALLVPLVLALGARGAALAWLAGNVAALALIISWLRSMVPGGLALEPKPLLAALAAAAVAAAAAFACAHALPPAAGLLAGALSGVVSAAVILAILDRSMHLGLRELANWVRGTDAGDRAP
jgi:O-antigen/teichoic acid export membrane protein